MNIDDELHQALRRESPPDGFRDRVMQRITATADVPQKRTSSRWRVAAAVMLLTTGTIGGITMHHIERQREGERAREQVMLALRIAGKKVNYVRDTLKGTSE
jgi:hypothetical protein